MLGGSTVGVLTGSSVVDTLVFVASLNESTVDGLALVVATVVAATVDATMVDGTVVVVSVVASVVVVAVAVTLLVVSGLVAGADNLNNNRT